MNGTAKIAAALAAPCGTPTQLRQRLDVIVDCWDCDPESGHQAFDATCRLVMEAAAVDNPDVPELARAVMATWKQLAGKSRWYA